MWAIIEGGMEEMSILWDAYSIIRRNKTVGMPSLWQTHQERMEEMPLLRKSLILMEK